MQRLSPPEYGSQGLNGHSDDIVIGLLSHQGNSRGLGVKSEPPGSWISCSEPFFHNLCPDLSSSSEFGNLFEKIVMGVKKEGKSRSKFVDLKSSL